MRDQQALVVSAGPREQKPAGRGDHRAYARQSEQDARGRAQLGTRTERDPELQADHADDQAHREVQDQRVKAADGGEKTGRGLHRAATPRRGDDRTAPGSRLRMVDQPAGTALLKDRTESMSENTMLVRMAGDKQGENEGALITGRPGSHLAANPSCGR